MLLEGAAEMVLAHTGDIRRLLQGDTLGEILLYKLFDPINSIHTILIRKIGVFLSPFLKKFRQNFPNQFF